MRHVEFICQGQCIWLRHYATSLKVTGSIPNYVIGFFSNSYSRTLALNLTQPPTEMSTRNLLAG
jgi:hypothetical protein